MRLFWQRHDTPRCDFDRPAFDVQRAAYDQALAQVARRVANVRVVNVADAFCDPISCRMAQAGSLLFRDENHLTIAGSRVLARQVTSMLEQQGRIGRRGSEPTRGAEPVAR